MRLRRDDELESHRRRGTVTGAASGRLGSRVEAFIDQCVGSVAELEVLLFFSRSGPLTRREAARRMAFEPTMIDLAVRKLADHELLVIDDDGSVAFTPHDPSIVEAVADLAAAYRVRRTAVIARIIRDRGTEA